MAVLRIGVVGANPGRSWAKDSHIPAIAQVPGLTLSAVATRDEDSARAAASAFGAPHWFADAAELCASDAVDLVVVLVQDIRDGTRTLPDFMHAARLTHVISTITRAAESGQRQTVVAA